MYKSSEKFNGKSVKDISENDTKVDLSKISPLIRIQPEEGQTFLNTFNKFLSTQDTLNMDSLVIGYWSDDYDLSDIKGLSEVVDSIFANKDKLTTLKALFIGAIEQEESEISWIELVDFSPFMNNGNLNLEYFRARGAGDFFKKPLKSNLLKKLALETGGMNRDSITHILQSNLPNLESLELWIGDDEYGNTSIKDIQPLFNTKLFPKLRYLGLRNCGFADELAKEIANAPIINQLEELDLSLGTLGDSGAKALATSATIPKLKKLNVDHHYINEATLKMLQAAVPNLSAKDKQTEDDWGEGEMHRYIYVSE